MPVGENTPLMRGSRESKISSCASSGNVPASHDIALKIVATHEDDGQPRATCARTSHCVWKSTSSPPYFRGAVMRNTPASASSVEVLRQDAPGLLGGYGPFGQTRHERNGTSDNRMRL